MSQEMRDRLVELLKQANQICAKKFREETMAVLKQKGCFNSRTDRAENFNEITADYLIANGVIVPPCKVGDTVCVVSQGNGFNMRWDVYEGTVTDIHLNRHNELTIRVENGEMFFGYYKPRFIHKTKEEAEKALRGVRENEA